MEPHAQFESRPQGRQDRVDVQHASARAQTHESKGESLPRTAHGGKMQALGGGAGQIIEVHAHGDA